MALLYFAKLRRVRLSRLAIKDELKQTFQSLTQPPRLCVKIAKPLLLKKKRRKKSIINFSIWSLRIIEMKEGGFRF